MAETPPEIAGLSPASSISGPPDVDRLSRSEHVADAPTLLQACWTADQLRGATDDRRAKKTASDHPLSARAPLPAVSLPDELRRSIRSVKPRNGEKLVALTFDLLEALPPDTTSVGSFLRKIMPFAFRAHHQVLGQEGFRLPAAVALLAIIQPELFHAEQMAGDVETRGDLTKGATVFDRRAKKLWRPNMDVATEVDALAATDCIVRGLTSIGQVP